METFDLTTWEILTKQAFWKGFAMGAMSLFAILTLFFISGGQ